MLFPCDHGFTNYLYLAESERIILKQVEPITLLIKILLLDSNPDSLAIPNPSSLCIYLMLYPKPLPLFSNPPAALACILFSEHVKLLFISVALHLLFLPFGILLFRLLSTMLSPISAPREALLDPDVWTSLTPHLPGVQGPSLWELASPLEKLRKY